MTTSARAPTVWDTPYYGYGDSGPWQPIESSVMVGPMRKTVHAIALPVALLLALGLSACNSNEVPVSESTGSDETTTSAHDDSSQKPTEKPSVRVSEKPSERPTTGPKPTATASTEGRTIHSTDLQVGDCFSFNNNDSETQVGDVEVVDCSAPHLYEVYSNYQIPQSTFPDNSTMKSEQYTACHDTFETYVGTPHDQSQYGASALTPSEDSWDQGDHAITCILMAKDGSQITGSLKGAAK